MLWTDEDQKQHPKVDFVGNVWIASVQAILNGYTFLVFKENVARKVQNGDMDKVALVSNNILSRNHQEGVHQTAKTAALQEPLCPAFDPDADDSVHSDGSEDDSDGEDEEEAGSGEEGSGKNSEIMEWLPPTASSEELQTTSATIGPAADSEPPQSDTSRASTTEE